MNLDPASLIVALTGGFTAVGAIITSRRGDKSKAAQQAAADQLAGRDQQWSERGEVIKDLRDELDRANTARERDRLDADKRAAAVTHRYHEDIVRMRRECSEHRDQLAETLRTVLDIVHDEIARAAAQAALDDDSEHTHHDEEDFND